MTGALVSLRDDTLSANSVAGYRIERKERCDPYKEKPERPLRGIPKRVALGECLVREEADLSSAETVFVRGRIQLDGKTVRSQSDVSWGARNTQPFSLRVVVLKREGGILKTVLRQSWIQSRFIAIPLLALPQDFGFDSGKAWFGWNRERRMFQNPPVWAKSRDEDLFKAIFGDLPAIDEHGPGQLRPSQDKP